LPEILKNSEVGDSVSQARSLSVAAGAGASGQYSISGRSTAANAGYDSRSATVTGNEISRWDAIRAAIASRGEHPRPPTALQTFAEAVFAAIVLVLTLPVMAVIGIVIKLDSPGPALFRQQRVGRGGKLFWFTKFRTYYVNAKERFPHLYAYEYTHDELKGLRFKMPNDPRMTRLGSWLRTSTLDELPNFWHVLNGTMSLVGPRPEIPEMLPYYTDDGLKKFQVRPGITGYSQTAGRGWLTFFETIKLDVAYVEERSFLIDVKVIFRTIHKILIRDGAF
jgi:lipopolysaccharide/colanic/teichoic acid biosynthesis glycosyltransferase